MRRVIGGDGVDRSVGDAGQERVAIVLSIAVADSFLQIRRE